MPIAPAPLPGKFDEDPRVHFDKTAGKFQYEDDESGQEFEWTGSAWIPLIDEDSIKAQQAAYSVAGVDENAPAVAPVSREERKNKRKAEKEDRRAELKQRATAPSAPKKTAVWVTNLPPDTTTDKIANVFSKAGVLLIGDDGLPRVKLYYDDQGQFKGDALVMYFKEGSVSLAVTLLDDTELEMGAGYGNMRVRVADWEDTKKSEGTSKSTENGNGANGADKEREKEKKKLSAEDKARISKRMRTLESKLTWHSDEEDDDVTAPGGPTSAAPGPSRFSRVVVLKGMFKLADLEKEPELLLELKEDVREEAETLGAVTNVVLYDKEEEGVMTIKFKDPAAAQACVFKMNGRFFDGQAIYAGIYNGRERYQKSGTGGYGDEEDEEKERLDNFAQWLLEGEGEN